MKSFKLFLFFIVMLAVLHSIPALAKVTRSTEGIITEIAFSEASFCLGFIVVLIVGLFRQWTMAMFSPGLGKLIHSFHLIFNLFFAFMGACLFGVIG